MQTQSTIFHLDAVAEAIGLQDGQRGVRYYLIEAQSHLMAGDHDFALDALSDALGQDDCTPKHWSRIMKARKACYRANPSLKQYH